MELDYNSIDRMHRMLDKFETLCCGDNCQRISQRDFTNFSVNEILKPSFGVRDAPSCYFHKIADIVSSTEELSDASSEYDNTNSENEIHETVQQDDNYPVADSHHLLPYVHRRKLGTVEDELLFQYSYADVKPFSMLKRIKQNNLEEDGYSSSDSESALDLRIERKKTPPKNSVPAWVFCTRYSDRPSAGPRAKRRKKSHSTGHSRNRVAFNNNQLQQLSLEFEKSPYLSEERRQHLANKLSLNEANVKIWFQNKRAKLKKETSPNPLTLQLIAQGLYNHRTVQLKGETDNSDSDISNGSTC